MQVPMSMLYEECDKGEVEKERNKRRCGLLLRRALKIGAPFI